MNEIWIIGTDPPCPRCDLMGRLVEQFIERIGVNVSVRHLSYDDPEVVAFGHSLGCTVGTATHVAPVARIELDSETVVRIITARTIWVANEKGCNPEDVASADQWSPELDEILKPCQDAVAGVNYIMTSVLAVDGHIIWQGSVPSEEEIAELLNPSFTLPEREGIVSPFRKGRVRGICVISL